MLSVVLEVTPKGQGWQQSMLATLSQRSSASQLQVGMGAFTNDVTSILGFLTPLPPPPLGHQMPLSKAVF